MNKLMAVLILAALLLSGCYSVRISASDGNYTMTPPKRGKVVGKVYETVKARHFLFGLTRTKVDIAKLLKEQNVHNAANIQVIVQHSVLDMILTSFTVGIYCPKTVYIYGDKVEQ